MPFRIIAFDGGGILGIIAARILHHLTALSPGLVNKVDLFAGTSTGGIIALGLANGLSSNQLVNFYQENGSAIFDKSWMRGIVDFGGFNGAIYDNTQLKQILAKQFGAKRLLDFSQKVLISSFDLDNSQDKRNVPAPPGFLRTWKPKFFHNFDGSQSDGPELVVDVAMRTSAAPTYFPSYEHYIDGGVVANNPSMAALAQALDRDTGRQQLGDISLLSLGVGATSRFIGGQDLDWGIGQWAANIITLMMSGVSGVADYQCSRLLGQRYLRINPVIPSASWKLDDCQDIPAMLAAVDQAMTGPFLRGVDQWLRTSW